MTRIALLGATGSIGRQALEIVQTHKENTEKLAKALLARETLTREAVIELLGLSTPASIS